MTIKIAFKLRRCSDAAHESDKNEGSRNRKGREVGGCDGDVDQCNNSGPIKQQKIGELPLPGTL